MAPLTWDQVGERLYETGVDHGVLYQLDPTGDYVDGVAWNGLTTVTESPSGAESNKQYADNTVYVNLISAEEFGGTIEAFTYPDEFAENDGTVVVGGGVAIGQQGRKPFGLCYRTLKGNDTQGQDHGYKLHLVYGAQASPSEKAYATVNDSPEAIAFSWDFSTTPVPVTGRRPTSLIVIDSTKVDAGALGTLEDVLYGTDADDARLPLPAEVLAMFTGTTTDLRLTGANAPAYNPATHVVTLPAVAGVTWSVNGEDAAAGAQPALAPGESAIVEARPQPGYALTGDDDWAFDY
jgi:hypothetical protein